MQPPTPAPPSPADAAALAALFEERSRWPDEQRAYQARAYLDALVAGVRRAS